MSHTIEVPGGEAEFFDADELTPRRKRPVEELGLQLGDLIQRIQDARKVTGAADDETTGLTGPDLEISDRQAALLAKFSDVATIMWLKSWTLDLPFPANPDALLDLPSKLYDALQREAGKLQKGTDNSEFEANDETLADPNSPTGVLGD